MRLGILGPVELHRDGRRVSLGGRRLRAIVALLALNANEVVSRDAVVDGVWGAQPPPTAERTLESYISRLRSLIGPDRLQRRAPGYVLRLERGELDLAEFQELVDEARTQTGDEATVTLSRALALWRGRALADVLDEPFAGPESARLEEERLQAIEEQTDLRLASGEAGLLVPDLERLVDAHPFRERMVEQLMLALYRSGRQTDALARYRATRQRLADELGLEPSPPLRALERRILAHEDSIAPPVPARRERLRRRWGRTPVLALVSALAAGGIAVAAGVLLGTGGTSASPDGTGQTRLVRLALTSGRIEAATSLAAVTPAMIASGAGHLWIADSQSDSVLKADPRTGAVVDRIQLPVQPGDISIGDRAVWVAGTAGDDVIRIDPGTDHTSALRLPSAAAGLCACFGALWTTDAGDDEVLRITPSTGAVRRLRLPWQPSAVTAGGGVLWVAGYQVGEVAQIDPETDTLLGPFVGVGQGPAALLYGLGFLWVANSLAGTVSRVDPASGSVTTVGTGSQPTALALAHGDVWVANEFSSTVSRIDAAGRVTQLPLAGEPTAVAAGARGVWVGTRPSSAPHGGTVVILQSRRFLSFDPQVDDELPPAEYLGLIYDTLLAYDQTSGANGELLVPDLAQSLPLSLDSNRVYVIRLRRRRISYSDARRVRASDFARGFVRMFRIGSPYAPLFASIRGAGACLAHPKTCSLAGGVVADDRTRTITFHLTRPDPDFDYKLALQAAIPVPPGSPMRRFGTHPFPGTGPYRLGRIATKTLTFVRNPRFHEWSHAAQPEGQPDRIVYRFGVAPTHELGTIIAQRADWTTDQPPGLGSIDRSEPSRVHVNRFPTVLFVQLNTERSPFSSLLARRAFNFAVDRSVLVRLFGGAIDNAPSCQIIAPGLPGFRRYCPYTVDPSTNGVWRGPNLAYAKQLVGQSRTRGDRITFWDVSGSGQPDAPSVYLAHVLRTLGYRTTLRLLTPGQLYRSSQAFQRSIQLQLLGVGPDSSIGRGGLRDLRRVPRRATRPVLRPRARP